MASKKNVPLKDEELTLSDKIDERFNSVDSDLAEIKNNKVDITSLETKVTNLPDNVWNHLDKKLDERQQRIIDRAKAEGKITPSEYMERLRATVTKFDEQHTGVANAVTEINNNLKTITSIITGGASSTSSNAAPISEPIEVIDVTPSDDLSFPSIPPKDGLWAKLLLYELPYYVTQRIIRSTFTLRFITLCSLLTAMVAIFTMLFVCRDNAYLHERDAKLQQTEAKYYLLRKASRYNKEWSNTADYIEMLYSDPEQNRAEIQRLWKKPLPQRPSSKKQ